jgi:hypothetical protein
MKLSGWWNWDHLRTAETLNGGEKKNIISLYFTHMFIGLREAFTQFLLCIASIIHAIIPFAFNFKLLELVVNQTRGLYKFLPQHPIWEELKSDLDDKSK